MEKQTNKVSTQPANAGGDATAITSPFNYSVDEEEERQKALDRASDKVPNAPFRPIL